MRHIVVIAYQLNPFRGSECAVAWDYIVNMSQNNRLTVIFGSSEEYHMIGNTKFMTDYISLHPLENVRFIPLGLGEDIKYKSYSALGIAQFYRQYRKWHLKAKETVMGILDKEKVDVIHYLGPIGYREPGALFGCGVPYIWGPIGGFGGINMRLLKATCSFKGGSVLVLRKFVNWISQRTNFRVRRAVNSSDVVIGATTEYTAIIKSFMTRRSRVHVEYLPENCIKELYPLNVEKFKSSQIRLIWIGRPDSNKGLILLLEALSRLECRNSVLLDIVGTGVLEEKLKKWADDHGLSGSINWHGRVDRSQVFELLDSAHLNIITSLYDANTTVIWEAMSRGVPTLALDHCGMHDVITDDTGIKIPIHSYDQVCNDIMAVLAGLLNDPDWLKQMALNVMGDREKYTWDTRKAFFETMYSLAINNHCSNGKDN